MNHRSPYEPNRHGQPNHDVEVRATLPDDAPQIAVVDAEWIDRPLDVLEGQIRGHLDKIASGERSDYSCVAVVAEQIVGYAKCAFVDWSEKGATELPTAWYLTGVTVARAFRRVGIGARLTEHRLDWLRTQTSQVYYFTGEPNRMSQDLHARFGFEEVGVRFQLPTGNMPEEFNLLYRKDLSG